MHIYKTLWLSRISGGGKMHAIQYAAVRMLLASVLLAISPPAFAGAINFGEWLQFSFTNAGTPAAGCDPADPAGGFCIPSSGTPTTELDAPPWTFSAPAQGVVVLLTDHFLSGDRFELFDFGTSLGLTSAFAPGVDCGDDPAVCINTAGMSTGRFRLAAGNHSLTIVPTASLGGGTASFLVNPVPEPATTALMGIGILGVSALWMRRRRQEVRR
jgi:hypothetical protein